MMKRNLITLALLFILAMAFLIMPVAAAGLTIVNGATISTEDGATSPVITITDFPIATGGTITINIFNPADLNQALTSLSFTTDNVVVSDNTDLATWTGVVDDADLDGINDRLTLTSTDGDGDGAGPETGVTAVGKTVTVTFTGAKPGVPANPWYLDFGRGSTWNFVLTATRTDGHGAADFNFVIDPALALSSAATTTDGTKVLVTFNKYVAAPLPAAPAGFTVTVNGVDNGLSVVALNAADHKIIELTLPTPVAASTDTVLVTYAPGTVTAADTGVLASFADQPVTNNVPAPPTVSAAGTNADGTKVLVTFTKNMADPPLAPAGFTVEVNSTVNVVSTVALNTTNHEIIELTLTTPVYFSTDDVKVNYTQGTVKAENNGVLAKFLPSKVTNKIIPIVTSIDPTGGSVFGGTVVTVTGSRFTGATIVTFGAYDQPVLDSVTDTQITVKSPKAISGNAYVTVTTPGGTSVNNKDAVFTYAPAPTVTSISPTTGYNYGPLSVTITGTGFVDGPGFVVTLKRDGYADIITATDVKVKSLEEITCTFPITGAIVGDWKVVVTNPGEQNNIIQMVGLAIANAANNNPPQGDTSDSYSTGQSTAAAIVVEPGVQGAPAAPAATGSVTAELSINDQGVISQSTDLQSADGHASVSIDAGVVALNQAGAPVSSVSIDTLGPSNMPDVPQGGAVSFAGIAYELGPNGAQFSPAISITFAAPPGQVGQDFTVRTYDHASGTWQDLPTSYDPQTGTVTAEVSHFCCFALFAKTVTTAPTAPVIAATIAATHVPTQLIPTKIAPPSPTIATTFLGIILWVVNLMIANPILLAGIAILAVGIVLMIWKQRRDRLNFRP